MTQLLGATVAFGEHTSVHVQLDLPELLTAIVPFAHAASGVRQELTAEALIAIAELAEQFRATVLEQAERDGYFDGDQG